MTAHSGAVLFPGHSGVRETGIADMLAREGSVLKFVGTEPSLGVSTQNIRRKIKGWMDNKHLAMWRYLSSTQRQTRRLILGPSSTNKTKLPSFTRIQFRVVIGLPTGHNIPRKHLH
jgi:hypothetical protein